MLRKLIAFAALAGAVAAITGLAYAAIPDANGVITACHDSQGRLKVIDAEAGQTCGANQQPLTWNQQGPQGPAGPQGPSGPQGIQGPAGPPGPSGISGWSYLTQGFDVPPHSVHGAEVYCPYGKKALGGGVARGDGGGYVVESAPAGAEPIGWVATVKSATDTDTRYYVWVICAYVSS